MPISSSSGFDQWVYGIDRFRRGRHGKTGMRRDLSVRSDGTVLTMLLSLANGICAICSILTKILQRGPDAPIAAQGRAGPACRPDCRSPAGDAGSRWTAPPIFQSVSFRQAQATSFGKNLSAAARPRERSEPPWPHLAIHAAEHELPRLHGLPHAQPATEEAGRSMGAGPELF